ncbi:alpha/beta hydrolase [uncultured Methylophaga sp.]|uniref:alpha/beta hydrolase n=1 Tax=uncultured Methylophaga sp. TaxID=285271 RepID=UPI002617EEB1|nr:alpha/beta hydrolase [uncultured Methylophaga sp.]
MRWFILIMSLVLPSVQADDFVPWNRLILTGGPHIVMGFAPPELRRTDVLNIFIEGDGMPGVALQMAKDIGGNSVYLGRPCQYLKASRTNTCGKDVWTSHRYSGRVVHSMNRAISAMKLRYQAKKVRLIGFSGGGTVASIAAAIRDDIEQLVTVAGNLDHKSWTDFNQIDPLSGSLNPIDFSQALEKVPQIHLIGERDEVVPGSVLTSYLSNLKKLDNVQSYIVAGADHTCCWSVAVAGVLQ